MINMEHIEDIIQNTNKNNQCESKPI